MAVTVTIHSESAPLARASGADAKPAIGAAWFVSATYAPGDIDTDPKKESLRQILSPWKWMGMEFKAEGATTGTRRSPPAGTVLSGLEALMKALLDTLIDEPAKLSLGSEDEDEHEPHWPLALMQLSRLDPRISHGLNLAALFDADIPDETAPVSLRPSAVTIGGARIELPDPGTSKPATVGDLTFELRCEVEDGWAVKAIRQKGRLLDGFTRRVAEGGETRRDWFSGLDALLGRTLSPVLRLADLIERGLKGDLPALVTVALTGLIEAIAEQEGETTPLGTLFGERSEGEMRAWEAAVGAGTAAIVKALEFEHLRQPLAASPTPDRAADTLRNALQSDAFAVDLAARLIALCAPGDLKQRAERLFADPRNVAALLDTLAPAAIARRHLAPALAQDAGGHGIADLKPLKTAFPHRFAEALGKLLKLSPVTNAAPFDAVVKEQVRQFKAGLEVMDGLDAAQDAGVAFRTDAVFTHPTDPGELDIHDTLDGALVAIRRSEAGLTQSVTNPTAISDWRPFQIVTRGEVVARRDPTDQPEHATEAPLGVLHTALPVGLIENFGGAETRVQQAIETFFGQALTPQSVEVDPSGERADRTALCLDYAAAPLDELELAYGRVFEVEVGYQSLAGGLPAGWCEPDAPFDFRPDILAGSLETRKKVAVLRTRAPGPPELADATGSRLRGPRDGDVRPLWRERVARWADPVARGTLDTATTIYLDALHPRAARRQCAIRPPGLSQPGILTDNNDRIREFWLRRNRELGLPDPDGASADPAVTGPSRGQAASRGGVRVTLKRLTPGGFETLGSEVLIFGTRSELPAEFVCEPNAAPRIDASGPVVRIVTAPTEMYAVELETLVDAAFFSGGADPRFDVALTKAPTVKNGAGAVTHYAFGRQTLVLECLPGEDHLPDAAALRDALVLEDTDGITTCAWAPKGKNFQYVGTVETVRQSWRWDGGPIDERALDAIDWNAAEENGPREAAWLTLEDGLFAGRGAGGVSETHQLGAAATGSSLLFRMVAPRNRGADYLRVRATAVSRYEALRKDVPELATPLRRVARAGPGPLDIWKALPLQLRRQDPLATPSLAVLAPTFGLVEPGPASAGDWCALLDHPFYDPINGGGLAERLVAEIVVETLDLGDAGKWAALALGSDPTLAGADASYEAGIGPDRVVKLGTPADTDGAWDPAAGTGAIVVARAVLGQTLEPFSAAPTIPFSLAFFPAAIGKHRLRPGTMIKARLRCEAHGKAAGADPGEPAAMSSPWSATRWLTVSANTDYADLFAAPAWDAGKGVLRLSSRPGATGDARFRRLRTLADDTAPDGQNPYLVQGLVAVLGRVVGDLRGDEVIRPFDKMGGLLRGRLTDAGLSFACGDLPAGEYVLRVLEMRTVSLPTPAPTTLETILPDTDRPGQTMDADGQILAIGPFWRFVVS